jgi:predicted dehydrogenase|tara:strand:+ start:408 stop:1355 length:948 start_codon:yes stop_codon:yes gene_type:complete
VSKVRIGIIGAGAITKMHLDVIADIAWIEAVGITSRTRSKAEHMAQEYGVPVCTNDVESLIKEASPDALMVLVSVEQIYQVATNVIPYGLPLFLEKPPGLIPDETRTLAELAKAHAVQTMVGFNRRYYSIFRKGLDIVRDKGPLLGISVEGHERFWKIKDDLSDIKRSKWIYANSTHTIDLLRYFGGEPHNINVINRSLFEKNGDQFAAIMNFDSGAIGSYNAHWYSPGGWNAVLYGDGVTVEFKPLESCTWTDKQFKTHEIKPDDVDQKYKPGFYEQMKAFGEMVSNDSLSLPGQDLPAAYKTMQLAESISAKA